MKERDQVLEAVKAGVLKSQCLDCRDFARLIDFFPLEDWKHFGLEPDTTQFDALKYTPKEWTKENILDQLKRDVVFGFEKALNKRGLSSDAMYHVVLMWLWVLDEEVLLAKTSYPMYGLPLFKAVALKFGFTNPIGEDSGSEDKYDNRVY